ncbi:MAG: hypothetical protein H6709_11935 [Kofleriaceae bacterium]|nr:hypothetical protein [Myxococcales bacterium]MCB9564736.1 hypothetical protein [Kofleriaceae bacterium]MCB9572786.1 hypothetical protein [Kofleriaceae bacterium]
MLRAALAIVPAAVVVGALAPAPARAEPWHPRLDIEPAAWLLGGYSVHVGVTPPAEPRLVLSAGAYAFDVPSALVDLASGNRDQGWDVRLYLGYGAFADYFVGAAPDRGWVVGAQLGAQHTEATLDGEAYRFVSALILLRAGYEWHPTREGLFVFPWLGAAITRAIAGDAGPYDTIPVTPYAAIDLGWRL